MTSPDLERAAKLCESWAHDHRTRGVHWIAKAEPARAELSMLLADELCEVAGAIRELPPERKSAPKRVPMPKAKRHA